MQKRFIIATMVVIGLLGTGTPSQAKLNVVASTPDFGSIAREIGAEGVTADDRVAKVSVVGVGMRSHAGVAARSAARIFATISNSPSKKPPSGRPASPCGSGWSARATFSGDSSV